MSKKSKGLETLTLRPFTKLEMTKTKGALNVPLETRTQGSRLIWLVLLSLAMLQGCLTRKQIEAASWLNNFKAVQELCVKYPELRDYGFYRKLNDGNLQFLSMCEENAQRMVSFLDTDLKKILDGTLPE